MNNLSIFIDIDQEFDRTLETIAMAGMAGKVNRLREQMHAKVVTFLHHKKATETTRNRSIKASTKHRILNELGQFLKTQSNIPLRNDQGKFTSSNTEIDTWLVSDLMTARSYTQLEHIRARLNPKAKEEMTKDFNRFVGLHKAVAMAKVRWNEAVYKLVDAVGAEEKLRNALADAYKEIKDTECRLRKLGYVAIMKILKDIEKKAKRA